MVQLLQLFKSLTLRRHVTRKRCEAFKLRLATLFCLAVAIPGQAATNIRLGSPFNRGGGETQRRRCNGPRHFGSDVQAALFRRAGGSQQRS